MAADIEIICPPIETLSNIDRDVPCPVPGCSKILPSKACLQMHVVKTHNIIETEEEKRLSSHHFPDDKNNKDVVKHFYCPVNGCSRSQLNMKPFPRLGQLKQHYMTVHAEKKHKCTKCNRGFGMVDACRRHQEKCGQMFPCTCGCPFTTREAMLTHARRKKHQLPDHDPLRIKQEKVRQAVKAAANVLAVKPKEIKPKKKKPNPLQKNQGKKIPGQYCMILPRPQALVPKGLPNMGTYHSMVGAFGLPVVNIKRDSQTQTDVLSTKNKNSRQKKSTKSTSSQTESGQQYNNPFDISSPMMDNLTSLNQSSIGVQANDMVVNNVSRMLDFACETEARYFDLCTGHSQASIGTQLDGSTFMGVADLGAGRNSISEFANGSLSLSSQTQTSNNVQTADTRFLNSSQTQTLDQVSLEDNAAQTLISILDFDPSSSDCGTQTKQMIDELLDQTTDVELAESQTQTWLSGWVSNSTNNAAVNQNFNERATGLEDPNCSTDCGTQTKQMLADLFDQATDVELTESQTQTWLSGWPESEGNDGYVNQSFDDRTSLDDFVDIHTQTPLIMPSLGGMSYDVGLTSAETQTITEPFCAWGSTSNTQTQMTQTAMGFLREFADSSMLMDTHTQTFLDDVSSLSSVQTQT